MTASQWDDVYEWMWQNVGLGVSYRAKAYPLPFNNKCPDYDPFSSTRNNCVYDDENDEIGDQ